VRHDGPVSDDFIPVPLLAERELEQFRTALDEFTVDGVAQLLGSTGRSAQARGDLAGMARATRRAPDRRLATLVRMFVLGQPVTAADADRALAPLPRAAAETAGLVESSGGETRALLDVRPYGEVGGHPWWVVSDFGADVRPGPLAPDHVLGVGAASVTLAQAVPRAPVRRALDIGTGSGVQALHLSRHAGQVCATDTSRRALRCAATTAALCGQHWDLRAGSLFEPVADETFDLVVANPPFVVSSGGARSGRYDYRDSGFAGDEVSARLLRGVGHLLAPDGLAVLLVNWLLDRDGEWPDRPSDWLGSAPCDAWVWQREVAEPGEYVTLWLRDAGEVPGSARFSALYDEWLDWFDRSGAVAVGMGMAVLWRTSHPSPIRIFDDVAQQVEQPAGPVLSSWIRRQRWLARRSDAELLASSLRPAADLVRTTSQQLSNSGWTEAGSRLRQSTGMRWEIDVDDALAALIAGMTVAPSPQIAVTVLAGSLGLPTDDVVAAVVPVIRDLVSRGFLTPVDGTADSTGCAR
jgi:methylase of polypeptide subunit release factors